MVPSPQGFVDRRDKSWRWAVFLVLALGVAVWIVIAGLRGLKEPEAVSGEKPLVIVEWQYNAPLSGALYNVSGRILRNVEIDVDYVPQLRDERGFALEPVTLHAIGVIPVAHSDPKQAQYFSLPPDRRATASVSLDTVSDVRVFADVDGKPTRIPCEQRIARR